MGSAVQLNEQKKNVEDGNGYKMQLHEIAFNQIDLKWGSYINPNEKVLTFHPDKSAIVSHFRMSDPVLISDNKWSGIPGKQFVVYREAATPYDLSVELTVDKPHSFFELVMSEHFFSNLVTDESDFLTRFHNYIDVNKPSLDFTAQMLPAMYGVINDMHHAPYNGHLKGMYLEAKAIELFLMQVKQLDSKNIVGRSKLKPVDIEALHEVRDYIARHYNTHFTITDLARSAGINQMKLKNGFKELFGTTVFGFVADTRMQEAKRLLLDERLYVNEVADKIGYQHAHHFTAAYKKHFGVLPSEMRR